MIETDRLILRSWQPDDVMAFAEMNKDEEVMRYLPKCLSFDETMLFYNRIIEEHASKGYGLYVVELKADKSFIGYTGFHGFDFDVYFSPGVEIGWRLVKKHWNKGYATEAAKACLDYARSNRMFSEVYSFTAVCNYPSQRVMQKIGMNHIGFFSHPLLPQNHPLKEHTLYKLKL